MELDVSRLKEKKGMSVSFEFEEKFEPIFFAGDNIAFDQQIYVRGTAINTGSGILVEGSVNAKIAARCSRCIEPVSFDLEVKLLEEFVKENGEMHEDEENEENAGDIEVHIFKEDSIEISDQVKANILANIPMKILCSTNCKGICAKCGQNLNYRDCGCRKEEFDPRFEKLKEWFEG